jgi:hypothetical protein
MKPGKYYIKIGFTGGGGEAPGRGDPPSLKLRRGKHGDAGESGEAVAKYPGNKVSKFKLQSPLATA